MFFKQSSLVLVIFLVLTACGTNQKNSDFLKSQGVAPAFLVKDQTGTPRQLDQLLKDGPIVLTFLRSFY